MAIKKNTNKTTTNENTVASNIKYNCKVTRAGWVTDDSLAFDMIVNGVTIYGCWYRAGVKDGEEWEVLNFPSYKGKGKYADRYFTHTWFPINAELKNDIINQITSLLGD